MRAAFASALLLALLVFGCISQQPPAQNPEHLRESVGALTFVPPQGFLKANEGEYISVNNGKPCIFYISGVATAPGSEYDLDRLASDISSNMEAQGGQVLWAKKSRVNSYESVELKAVIGGVDQLQTLIKLKNNFAIAAYGTEDACESSFESILQSITSISESD